MSKYEGYDGRNVYYNEFWFPALNQAQKLVISTLAGALAILIPYVPTAALDPLLFFAGWSGDDFYATAWRRVLGLKRVDVVIDNNPVPAYEFDLVFIFNQVVYELDDESNKFVNIQRLYPDSPIPLRWYTNVIKTPIAIPQDILEAIFPEYNDP